MLVRSRELCVFFDKKNINNFKYNNFKVHMSSLGENSSSEHKPVSIVPASDSKEKTNDPSDPAKKVKRSFSSYLSNMKERKQELDELAEQEKKKKEEQENEEKEKAERLAKEKDLREKEEKELKEKEELAKIEKEKQDKLDKEKQEQERLEREKKYIEEKEKLMQQEKQQEKQDNIQEEKDEEKNLEEKQKEYDEKKEDIKNSSVTFSDIEKKEIDSDAETVYSDPPIKVRRGRLIKKSELDKHESNDDEAEDEDSYLDDEDDHIKPTLKHYSRSVSPNTKGKALQKPKKRTGRDSSGRLKLQRVCEKGKYNEAKSLIENGADVNDQDYAGNSALHEASLNGFTDIVQLLIDNGAEIDMQSGPDDLDTPLIDAASNGHISTVKLLLKSGADPRIENAHGQNALDSIDEDLEDTELLKNLLKKAAKNLFKKEQEKKSNNISRNQSETESSDHEVKRNRSQQRGGRKDMIFVDFTSKSGRDEVYQRASDGDSQYVGTYLGNGGKPDSEAMTLAAKYGHLDVVSLFLGFGAKVDISNKLGMTPLMRTVGRGHLEVVKLLIEHGADPLKRSKDGKNAIDYARDSLIFDSEEINYLKEIIEKKTGERIEISPPTELNTEDIKFDDDETMEEVKRKEPESEIKVVKKRKVSTNESQQPEHKKKKHDLLNKESSKKEIIKEVKIEEKSKKLSNERSVSGSNLNQLPVQPQRKISQPIIETEEEKQIRIQKEKEQQKLRERYQSEIAEKQQKRKEEFLNKFESQELKKQEELKKLAELEEERRIQQELLIRQREKEEEERREMMNKEEEKDRRLKIRNDYPFGLRNATFNNNRTKEEVVKYLPLYYWKIDDVDYVVDIQIILILGFENFQKKYSELYKTENCKLLKLEDKSKIFNIIYTILKDNSVEYKKQSNREKFLNYQNEFKKFNNIQIHFIKLEEVLKIIDTDYNYLKGVINSRIIKCSNEETPNEALVQFIKNGSGLNNINKVIDSRKQIQQMESDLASKLSKELPHNLRYRPSVVKALVRNRRMW